MGVTIGLGRVFVALKSYGVVTGASEEKLSKPSLEGLDSKPIELGWECFCTSLRAGRMCPSLGSASEVPTHGNFLAQKTGMGLSRCYLSPWLTPGPVLITGSLTLLLWGTVGEGEEGPRWMLLEWAPAVAPRCSPWRFFHLLFQLCMSRDTAPHCFPCQGPWKSCWLSIANTVKKCLHWPRLIFVCSNLSPGLPAGEGASFLSGEVLAWQCSQEE